MDVFIIITTTEFKSIKVRRDCLEIGIIFMFLGVFFSISLGNQKSASRNPWEKFEIGKSIFQNFY
jgi:hypothetical protein